VKGGRFSRAMQIRDQKISKERKDLGTVDSDVLE
jgi:hypothetical protein